MSQFPKGHVPWNKGIPRTDEEKRRISIKLKGRKLSKTTKRRMSTSRMGHPVSEKMREKISKANKGRYVGRKLTKKWRENISKGLKGKKSYLWKGGITPLYFQIRNSSKYHLWRDDVYMRDNFICRECGDNTGGNLEAHHIKWLSKIIEKHNIGTFTEAKKCKEMWDINNGLTLCLGCHIEIHKGEKNANN